MLASVLRNSRLYAEMALHKNKLNKQQLSTEAGGFSLILDATKFIRVCGGGGLKLSTPPPPSRAALHNYIHLWHPACRFIVNDGDCHTSLLANQIARAVACQLSDRMSSFPTSLAGEVERGLGAGQFPGPDSAASLGGTPDFIQFGERRVCRDEAESRAVRPSTYPPATECAERNSIAMSPKLIMFALSSRV